MRNIELVTDETRVSPRNHHRLGVFALLGAEQGSELKRFAPLSEKVGFVAVNRLVRVLAEGGRQCRRLCRIPVSRIKFPVPKQKFPVLIEQGIVV
jgi:hypothetical protein